MSLASTRAKNYNTAAPINYVAGLGRGCVYPGSAALPLLKLEPLMFCLVLSATGFTTRSDIGPARVAPEACALTLPTHLDGGCMALQ